MGQITENQMNQITQGLWDHQKNMVHKAVDKKSLALFAEMGVGKSAASIGILRLWFLQQNRILPTLVLCPPVVILQWQEEFYKWSKLGPHTVPLIGTGKKRAQLVEAALESSNNKANGVATSPIFITNYETLLMKSVFDKLLKANIQVGIFDESQKVKNHASKRTKQATILADKMRKKLILTGTPVLNGPMDLFSQYRILDGGKTFGDNFFVFRAKYFQDVNAGMRGTQKYFPNWKPRKGIEAEFNKALETTSLRVLKSECLDLPDLVRVKIPVEMSPEQKRVYTELKEDLVALLDEGAVVADMALTKILRLQQIVSGFVRVEKNTDSLTEAVTSEEIHFNDVPRLKALEEVLIDTTPNKVIVWSAFKSNYKAIAAVCDANKIQYRELHGGQTAKQREDAIQDFRKDPEIRVMIANPKAGGVGLNLIEASYSVYYSRGYSLEDDLQSEARNYRGGSEMHEKVTRIDLYTPGSVDSLILNALERKQNIAEKILDMKQEIKDN